MTEPDQCFSLELTEAATPIRGVLRDEHGHIWTFSSWLGLLAALNAASPGTGTRQADDPRNGPCSTAAAFDADVLDTPADG